MKTFINKIIQKRTIKYEKVRETDDSYCEYTIYDKDIFYLFGKIRIWSRNYNFEIRPPHEWIKKMIGC